MSEPREWTLMFYLACDNALTPVVVSLLKEMKDAGFQANTDVVVHFDPQEPGVPTRIYEVNRKRRAESKSKTHIGDGNDPFVRNLDEDDIIKTDTGAGPAARAIRRSLGRSDRIEAERSLREFIAFCREKHPAERYMLFLVGHGMVVGNDSFLPDDHPVSAISLKKLGNILSVFAPAGNDGKPGRSALELLSLHSCSMSAIEVAYELKGKANFLIASEGPAFVGSWPYRQLLKKIFDNVVKTRRKVRNSKKGAANSTLNIRSLVEKLYFLTLYNATDFMLAGYSHDLALCSLDPQEYADVTASVQKLVAALTEGLKASSSGKAAATTESGKSIKDLVLLAHWEAQSYWGESYTDLYDFCRCLFKRCDRGDTLATVCAEVMKSLDKIIIRSENFGSEFQYSRGLSIYFPWSAPVETVAQRDENGNPGGRRRLKESEKGMLDRYKDYAFTKELGKRAWINFLTTYFTETERASRRQEDGKDSSFRKGLFAAARRSFNPFGPFSRLNDDPKPSPRVGIECSCPSIKNYPKNEDDIKFSITDGAAQAFE